MWGKQHDCKFLICVEVLMLNYFFFILGKRTNYVVCQNNCICKDYPCSEDKFGYCNKNKTIHGDWICECKACDSHVDDNEDSGEDDSNDGDE